MNALRFAIAAASIAALAGCAHPRAVEGREGHPHGGNFDASGNISANAFFGGVNVTALQLECAGRVALAQGQAVVKDGCFSGDTNVVICTDATAPNPIKCAPSQGKLEIAGAGADVISYARVH